METLSGKMGLNELIGDYVISLELGEHKKVSQLSSEICAKLIEILDDYLAEREDDDDDAELSGFDKQLIQAIGLICDRIRKYDDLSVAYHDVTSFVHLYDMVCFSSMVGAIPHDQINAGIASKQPESGLPIDVDYLAYIMRSACHLLRYMNGSREHQDAAGWLPTPTDCLWFDANKHVDKISSVGFPTYTLNIGAAIASSSLLREQQKQQFNSINSFLDHLKSVCTSGDESLEASETLGQTLGSKWFYQFLTITLSQSYPLDRFSSLIALWIVADICECNNLEQVMSELVDQIFHEESNSCNLEELMQLGGQAGSYWLSYHRRHRATFAKGDAALLELDEDEDEDEGDREGKGGDGHNDDDDKPSLDSIESEPGVGANSERNSGNSHAKLRRLIRQELLEGPNCLICGSRPREPLACLRQQRSCLQCLCEMPQGEDFCALSRRTLPLVRLETLEQFKIKQQGIVLVTPNEWTRQMLTCGFTSSRLFPKSQVASIEKSISERIDIEANFERLTIIRDADHERQGADDEEEEERDDENDDEEGDVYEPSRMRSTLKLFMMSTESRRDPTASESVKMLRFVSRHTELQQSSDLFLCSSDILILGQQDDWRQLELRLMAANSQVLFSAGSLWTCDSRSPTSKLKLGCGRLFSSLELLQLTTTTNSDEFTCCFCQRELRRVSSFPGNLQWQTRQ